MRSEYAVNIRVSMPSVHSRRRARRRVGSPLMGIFVAGLLVAPMSASAADGAAPSALAALGTKADRLIFGHEPQSYSANSEVDQVLVSLARSYGRLAEKATYCDNASEASVVEAYRSTFQRLSRHFTYRHFYYTVEQTIGGADERMQVKKYDDLANVYARDGIWVQTGSSAAAHGHVSVTGSQAPFVQGRKMIHEFADPDCSHYSGDLKTKGKEVDLPQRHSLRPDDTAHIDAANVMLRSQPGPDSGALAHWEAGRELTIRSVRGNWYEVEGTLSGTSGFLPRDTVSRHGRYINFREGDKATLERDVTLYRERSTDSTVVASLNEGRSVRILELHKDWYHVKTVWSGDTGYLPLTAFE